MLFRSEEGFEEDLFFEASEAAEESDAALLLDIDGFEGPLHLLLDLARKQKVDLARSEERRVGKGVDLGGRRSIKKKKKRQKKNTKQVLSWIEQRYTG